VKISFTLSHHPFFATAIVKRSWCQIQPILKQLL
jgi:hypothetical protein